MASKLDILKMVEAGEITPAEAEATARMFDTLLGDDLPARKAFISAHGAEYMKTADL